MPHRALPLGSSTARQPTDSAVPVLWTRGRERRALAEALAGDSAQRAESDVTSSCIAARAGVLVARHPRSFDLCSVVTPHGFSPSTTRSVVATVGGGPHSPLAAAVAQRLSERLGVPSLAIYAYRHVSERSRAVHVLDGLAAHVQHLDTQPVLVPNPAAMVAALPVGTLLVVGAPGGSWSQRQFFGPGAHIKAKAPSGTIVVHHAPARVYQVMQPPVAFGPHMRAADAMQLSDTHHLIVAQEGRLLGLVAQHALLNARPAHELKDIMDAPVSLSLEDPVDHARSIVREHPDTAIPVIDGRDHIVGTVAADDLDSRPLI